MSQACFFTLKIITAEIYHKEKKSLDVLDQFISTVEQEIASM